LIEPDQTIELFMFRSGDCALAEHRENAIDQVLPCEADSVAQIVWRTEFPFPQTDLSYGLSDGRGGRGISDQLLSCSD
jgi:hypothetical protein